MSLGYVGSRWELFAKKFPDAWAFLIAASLEGELNHLSNVAFEGDRPLTAFEARRLDELLRIEESIRAPFVNEPPRTTPGAVVYPRRGA